MLSIVVEFAWVVLIVHIVNVLIVCATVVIVLVVGVVITSAATLFFPQQHIRDRLHDIRVGLAPRFNRDLYVFGEESKKFDAKHG